MIRIFLIMLVLATPALAQKIVNPDDLTLKITLENTGTTPYQNEMVLLTIHGIYRRHITLEKLEQPDLGGINWMQLGHDHWFESMIDGLPVKNMRRRIALFPEDSGRMTIGPFIHHLTLLDEDDNWFGHDIQSEPITLDVQPAPEGAGWWFPVRELEISDTWSNPPDQLGAGDGVLRIVTLKAVGVAPEMLPPMPELTSPSAHIFAHPEKRLVDLSPDGPVSIAFWRWTIKPKNPPSSILEPIEVPYFNTTTREHRIAKISAQRVAIDAAELPEPTQTAAVQAATLSPLKTAFAVALPCLIALGFALGRERRFSIDAVKEQILDRRLMSDLKSAARGSDPAALRHPAHRLHERMMPDADRQALLDQLDTVIYASDPGPFDTRAFLRTFRQRLTSKAT